MRPLNGTKTHPLSKHALDVLRDLAKDPKPSQEINPGVVNRLLREALVTHELRPSPYRKHRGYKLLFLVITPAGLATLAQTPNNDTP